MSAIINTIMSGLFNRSKIVSLSSGAPPTPANAYVAEDGSTFYVAEDGTTYYVQET